MRENTERRLRYAVARRAGCAPGDFGLAPCAYCNIGLLIDWRGDRPLFRMMEWREEIQDFVETEPAHLDHVIPESHNGPTSLDNTVLACRPCNIAKGDSAFGDPAFLAWLTKRRLDVAVHGWPDTLRRALEATL